MSEKVKEGVVSREEEILRKLDMLAPLFCYGCSQHIRDFEKISWQAIMQVWGSGLIHAGTEPQYVPVCVECVRLKAKSKEKKKDG